MRLFIIFCFFFLKSLMALNVAPVTASQQEIKSKAPSLSKPATSPPATDSSKLAQDHASEMTTIHPSSSSADLANQASAEQLLQVSTAILRTKLQQEVDPIQRYQISLRLVEISLTEGDPAQALAILDSKDMRPLSQPANKEEGDGALQQPSVDGSTRAANSQATQSFASEGESEKKSLLSTPSEKIDEMVFFWKAQALLALKRPGEAAPLLEKLIQTLSARGDHESLPPSLNDYLEASQIALARAYRGQGEFIKAVSALDLVTPHGPMASLVLQEKIAALLALGKYSDIEQIFKTLTPQTLAEQTRLAYLFALVAAQQGDYTEALKRFNKIGAIDQWTSSAVISGIVDCDLSLNKPAEAQLVLEKYLQENPQSARLPQLIAQLERLYILQNNNDVTLLQKWSKDTTQPWRASYAMLPYARTLERLGHRDKANEWFTTFLATYPHHELKDHVALELAQNKLLQGDAQGSLAYVADRTDLPSLIRARYAFERGLAESALKHPSLAEKAFSEAASFNASLSSEALYNKSLIQIASSNETTSAALKNTQDQHAHEREEYLGVISTDQGTRQSALAVMKAARHFLEIYPQSPFSNEVRMKLGEALLSYGNVREARLELETVGKLEPSSELGRQALFLAAQAASRSMDPKSIDDALMLLEQVAQNTQAGTDAWQARLEQAALKNAQTLPLEAIAIYDQILSSSEPSSQLRNTAQMAKADTLNGLATKDPKNYQAAITIWRQLADQPNISPYWRNQSLCKIGLTDEKLGDLDSALAAYYEALKTPLNQEPELLWHDKAAFQAAQLLESRKEWNEAIRLYQQILSEGGPRANEAQERISKLRLENFLWDK